MYLFQIGVGSFFMITFYIYIYTHTSFSCIVTSSSIPIIFLHNFVMLQKFVKKASQTPQSILLGVAMEISEKLSFLLFLLSREIPGTNG